MEPNTTNTMRINWDTETWILDLNVFDKMTPMQRIIGWQTLCYIVHFCKHTPEHTMSISIKGFAERLGVNRNLVRNAYNLFLERGWIEVVQEWQRKGHKPRIIKTTKAWAKVVSTHGRKRNKSMGGGTTSKVINKLITKGVVDSSLKESSPPSNESNLTDVRVLPFAEGKDFDLEELDI